MMVTIEKSLSIQEIRKSKLNNLIEGYSVSNETIEDLCESMRMRVVKCCEKKHENKHDPDVKYARQRDKRAYSDVCPLRPFNLTCAHPRKHESAYGAYNEDYIPMVRLAAKLGKLSSTVKGVSERLWKLYPEARSEEELLLAILGRCATELMGIDYARRFVQKPIPEQIQIASRLQGNGTKNYGETIATPALIRAGMYQWKLAPTYEHQFSSFIDVAGNDEGERQQNLSSRCSQELGRIVKENLSKDFQFDDERRLMPVLSETDAVQVILREEGRIGRQLKFVQDRLLDIFDGEEGE